jgi:cytochrome P450
MTWGIKRLADNQDAQNTLRSRLRETYADAAAEHRNPTVDEITKTPCAYLDAVIEEILRMAVTFPGVIRNATVDTNILGYHIPKGTDVFLLHNGPGYFTAPFEIPEEKRSESARTAKYQAGSWDPNDMKSFKPERWLIKDEAGDEAYDAMAGPHLAFGLGPRGCFGRRMAYLELRIILVMLIWNFELKKCPEKLSSYDAIDKLSRQSKCCYVRLAKVEW